MITSTSKNNTFMCVENICDDPTCRECNAHAEQQQVQSLWEQLHDSWTSLRLFLGTDRWDRAVTLQRGDSHYTMKMEEIESHWRHQ